MESYLQDLAEAALRHAEGRNVQYCDVRAEQSTKKSASVEDHDTEYVRTVHDVGIGIRLLYNGAWGFCSIADPASPNEMAEQINQTIRGTIHYSQNQKNAARLADTPVNSARIRYPVQKSPDMDELIKISLDCNRIILGKENVTRATASPEYTDTAKYFVSSEGSSIIQEYTDVVIRLTAVAHGSGHAQSVDITEGGRGGVECITQNDTAYDSAGNIAERASRLLRAGGVAREKTTVVMNPDFVALLAHEILGHPSEADRVLGREMAWAGNAWWAGMRGQRIGSDSLTVFDDPSIRHSLGWYYFDDEGVRAEKTVLVEDGILKNHMQSRETAEIFNASPTGNMRASGYGSMPLIRMACTCIGRGDFTTDEIIGDVKDGYLISNMKVPSIDMRRYDWSISCQYAHKISNGEITDMCRDMIVTGTAPEFFHSIDACGRDLTVRPITNCGKGDPMQQLMMGNGGPTVRGTATVNSAR